MSHSTALIIAITVVVTVAACFGIFAVWVRRNETPDGKRRVLDPVFILLLVSVLMNGFGLLGISAVTGDTNKAVDILTEQTSPARVKAQQKAVEIILTQIDCNGANRLQVGFDGLASQGLIHPVDVLGACTRKAP